MARRAVVEAPRAGKATVSNFDLIVLDFDGTFSDVEKEAAPFLESYLEDVRGIVGADVRDDWEKASAKVDENPAEHGWTYGGLVVAPGASDPYLRATVVMNMIFDARGLYADADERTEVLQGLYHRNYPKAGTVFRPEAKDVVDALIETGTPVVVVTNSATAAVEKKIDLLAPKHREKLRICGDAKKYIVQEPAEVDAAFAAIPKTMKAEGLNRPILLRRGPYYTLLQELWAQYGAKAETTLVAGDIFELDLAMPAHLGAAVQLVTKEGTPQFERNAVGALERGGVSADLHEVLRRAGA